MDWKNSIKFHRFNSYIHIYRLEGLNNWLRSEKELLIEESKKEKGEDIVNYFTTSELINNSLNPLITNVALQYYHVGSKYDWVVDTPPMVYYQTKEEGVDRFHHHYFTSTITATTYIDPMDKEHGGGLEFFFHDMFRPVIHPEPDCIYFFPAWVLHRPLPHSIDIPRLCINWGLNCSVRPIHKLTGDRW